MLPIPQQLTSRDRVSERDSIRMSALLIEQQQNGELPTASSASVTSSLRSDYSRGGVTKLAFSPDGKLLASADGAGYTVSRAPPPATRPALPQSRSRGGLV